VQPDIYTNLSNSRYHASVEKTFEVGISVCLIVIITGIRTAGP